MDKINATKEENRKVCENILKKGDKQDQDDLNIIEKIISKDNTEPIYIEAYLKLLKKLKSEQFLKQIIKYEYFLPKELINKEFAELYPKKYSSSELFHKLYEKIISYNNPTDLNEKMLFYKDLVSIVPDYYINYIKGFTDYSSNKELSIFIIILRIKKGIIKHIKEIEK